MTRNSALTFQRSSSVVAEPVTNWLERAADFSTDKAEVEDWSFLSILSRDFGDLKGTLQDEPTTDESLGIEQSDNTFPEEEEE